MKLITFYANGLTVSISNAVSYLTVIYKDTVEINKTNIKINK